MSFGKRRVAGRSWVLTLDLRNFFNKNDKKNQKNKQETPKNTKD